jgi:hypothetical protein
MRHLVLGLLLLALCESPLAQTTALEPQDELALGQHLAELLRAGRSVISENQDLINDPAIGDKGLDGNMVVDAALALYTERTGAPPLDPDAPEREQRLAEALIESMREVVDEHESEIDMAGVGFKGFIPAIFARLVSERFAEKVGSEALLKVTAPVDLVRNRKSRPDDWERAVIESRFESADWPEGEAFTEQVDVGGRPAFRMLIPEYYAASCLACHGQPAGEIDVSGYPKEGGKEGELGGAISIILFQ